MNRRFFVVLSALCIFSASGMLKPVFAQSSDSEEFSLEEITVTAQKRAENQQKVPIAMESISGEDIKKLGKNDIDQILSDAAGALVNKAGDGLRVSIRGLSQDSGGNLGPQSSAPTVAVNMDGVFSNRNSSGQNLFDLERVEVLFGPQSTLYASNSPGGIINIITADPKVDKYEASGSIEYGRFSYLRTEGMVNAPLGSQGALRAAFTTSVRDGYLSNGADNEDTKSMRLKGIYKPSENISFLVTGEYSRDNSIMGYASQVVPFENQDDTNPWTAATSLPDPNNQIKKNISGRIDVDFGFATMVLVPSYSDTENSTSRQSMDFFGNEVTDDITQDAYEKGVEGRVVSSGDFMFDWIAGFNWYESEDSFFRTSSDGGGEIGINQNESKALFGNITYPVTEVLRVTGGLRASWDDVYQYTLRIPETDPTIASFDHQGTDYMAGVEYDLGADSMLFANFSTGYRAQLAQAVDADGNAFPPEKIDAWTIGSKNRFFNDRLQFNASAYYYQYKNYLAVDMVPSIFDANGNGVKDDDENISQPDDNAKQSGDLDIYGVDIQTTTVITDKDILDLSVSYLKTEFTRLAFDYWDITNSLGIEDQDLTGAEKTNSPRWTVNASYSHNFDLGNGGQLTARLDSRYQSEYFLTWQEKSFGFDGSVSDITALRTQEAYHLSNASVVYTNPDGKWTLTGYVKNLEDYAVKKSWISGLMIIGAPRTYGAVLSAKF